MYKELRDHISKVEDELSAFYVRNELKLEQMVWSEDYETRLHAKEFRFLTNRYVKGPAPLLLTDMVGCKEWLETYADLK